MATRRRFISTTLGLAALYGSGQIANVAAHDATPAASPIGSPVAEDIRQLPVKHAGQLTVHTDSPVYEPWFVDDDPANGQGFESALIYALAARLGFEQDQIVWGVTPFAESFAPGPKDFDLFVTEVLITGQRREAVDFSDPYYTSQLTLIARDDSPLLDAQTLADLKPFTFGAQSGTNNATYITEIIQPDTELVQFDSNLASMQALSDGEIDAILEPLQTGQEVATVQFDNLALVALLPDAGHDMGIVFEKGSGLVAPVNQALQSLKEDGTLDALVAQWLPVPEDLPEMGA